MKLTRANMAKRFRWSRYYPKDKDGHPAIRLTCAADGTSAKVTRCRALTPEEILDMTGWLKKVAKDLMSIRASDGSFETAPKRKKKAA